VSSTTIGIKIADGSFYPIVEKDSVGWKRLIVTTVRDGQQSVQIDLYEGEGQTLESAKYVGSLLIEDIAPAEAGENSRPLYRSARPCRTLPLVPHPAGRRRLPGLRDGARILS